MVVVGKGRERRSISASQVIPMSGLLAAMSPGFKLFAIMLLEFILLTYVMLAIRPYKMTLGV